MKLLLMLLLAVPARAYQIVSVQVSGDSHAEMNFSVLGNVEHVPSPRITEETIEFTLKGAALNESFGGMLDLKSPHAFIQRVLSVPTNDGVKVNIALNPGVGDLTNRIHFKREGQGLRLLIHEPGKETETLKILKEEQKALPTLEERPSKPSSSFNWAQVFIVFAVFILMSAGAFFLLRFLRNSKKIQSKRKFLIEQISYFGLGQKTGVSLLKVGSEFVLVGVTPHQVTFLSTLPALTSQYSDESQFERDSFREAVAIEVGKIKQGTA